ncbi:MAG TPA: hypothetical protein VK752_03570 [Bryobacteraceae bacterium]|nr:hypothetical protein [Bryobacteraceae bacterium]
MKLLFDVLGRPRNTKSEIICYESADQHFFVRTEKRAGKPQSAGTVLVRHFPTCFGQPKNITLSAAKEWKTEKGIGLGSTASEVEKAYGKPSTVNAIESATGLFYGDSAPVGVRPEVGQTQWSYNSASDDLKATIFGIRRSKVAWILITHNE